MLNRWRPNPTVTTGGWSTPRSTDWSAPHVVSRLSRGPVGCSACDLAHGFRYSAIETDRPGVPPGNEHAVRVNVSVVRRPQITSENEVLARRLLLPVLLTGVLPSTEEAQRMSALIKRSSPTQKIYLIEQAIEETLRRQRSRSSPSN